ncbi:MAG: hypothetical protein ACREXP_16270, partial [Steroidobacteraceae bacterium]
MRSCASMATPRLIERLESAGGSGGDGTDRCSVTAALGGAVVSGAAGAGCCSGWREHAASTSVVAHISVEIRREPRMQSPGFSRVGKKPLQRILRPRHSRIHAQQNTAERA